MQRGEQLTEAELDAISEPLEAGRRKAILQGTQGSRTIMSVEQARRLVAGCRRLNAMEAVLGEAFVGQVTEMLEGSDGA